MAEIRPLRAWRYNKNLHHTLENLVSPLFDVVSEKQREKLYEQPLNSIQISVPKGETPAESAAKKIAEWKQQSIIVQDDLPSIYVYYQHYALAGSSRQHVRKGFIANLRICDWHEKVLLRHENTMPFSVEDRMQILDKTQMNVSPTHGLYTHSTDEIEQYLDNAMVSPLYETEDYQGVREVLAVIQDAATINRIMEILSDKQIILADGHHRYESALMYQKKRTAGNANHSGEEGYNFHMMFFTNTEADDLRILPTHRLVKGLAHFSKQDFLDRLSQYFTIKQVEEDNYLPELILRKKWTFGLLLDTESYKIQLRKEAIKTMDWDFPADIQKLDLTVLHYFIIEKCLHIKGRNQRASKNLTYERSFSKCVQSVSSGKAQCAIITQEIPIETVKEVCYSGYTLPQKSTYFYPKVISGLLFGSIDESEFHSFFDRTFTHTKAK